MSGCVGATVWKVITSFGCCCLAPWWFFIAIMCPFWILAYKVFFLFKGSTGCLIAEHCNIIQWSKQHVYTYILFIFTHDICMSMQNVTLYSSLYIHIVLKLKICKSTSRYRYTHLYRSIQYPYLTSKHVNGCTFDSRPWSTWSHLWRQQMWSPTLQGEAGPKRPTKQLLMLHDIIFSLEKKDLSFWDPAYF